MAVNSAQYIFSEFSPDEFEAGQLKILDANIPNLIHKSTSASPQRINSIIIRYKGQLLYSSLNLY